MFGLHGRKAKKMPQDDIEIFLLNVSVEYCLIHCCNQCHIHEYNNEYDNEFNTGYSNCAMIIWRSLYHAHLPSNQHGSSNIQ